MSFEKFVEEYLEKGLLKRQKIDFRAVEKLILRASKDLKAAKANLEIDKEIAYSIAYLAMLHAARAFMLLKSYRPADGYQHKTAVEFMAVCLGDKYKTIVEHFDKMRRKRNLFTYELSISVSDTEAYNALNAGAKFVDLVKEMIQKENPQVEFKFNKDVATHKLP
ncbi:MAG: HEPN domain-containing protein [Candidatus Omnitrophota bacterium]